LVQEIISYLSQHFEMRHSPANHFGGLSISKNRSDHTLFVSQPNYIRKILWRFHMLDCLPKDLPVIPETYLQKKTGKSPSYQFPYRKC
jgi:hypothetical protein